MRGNAAFPFLVLPEEAVRFGAVMIGDPGKPLQPVGDMLEDWDYARDLEVRVGVTLDFARASEALQIPVDQLKLRLALLAGTGAGALPRRQDRVCAKAATEGDNEVELGAILPGRSLSGRLRLSLLVTLDGSPDGAAALSPRIAGARLWQHTRDILIEDGGDSRFPVEAVSFSEVFHGEPRQKAPWFLDWRPGDLESDFSASVRLYVNSDRQALLERFVAGDAPTLQAMLGDAVTQMVETTLRIDDFADEPEKLMAGSVGRQIHHWLDLAFPGTEPGAVLAMLNRDPGKVRASLLAVAEMGE